MSTSVCNPPESSSKALQAAEVSCVSPLGADAQAALKQAKIAVIDDEPVNIKVVCRLLNLQGFENFVSTNNAEQAIALIQAEQPDLILLDLMMPGISGLDILRQLRQDTATQHTPVVILTASTDHDTRIEVLQAGANDFLNKPIDPSELAPRLSNIISLKQHQDQMRDYSKELETAVRERTAELEASRQDVIHCLARAAEYRDDDTGHHVLRVGKYARLIGEALGFAGESAVTLEHAAQLHDVGKIGVPDSILQKPGKLTDEEFSIIQKHCGFGKRILHPYALAEEKMVRTHAKLGAAILEVGSSPVLDLATKIALTHHEWWDGTGYPLGLKGEDIPLEGRITAVADVFDALSSRRCYKDAFPLDKCFQILEEESGTHFDPAVVEAFFVQRDKIVAVQIEYADEV